MKRAFRLRPVTRRHLAWLVVLLLSWQQVAVAAYVCVSTPASAGVAAVAVAVHSSSMAAMGDGCAEMPAAPVDPLCHQHCQPDHATQVDARSATVPASMLAALPPESPSVAAAALPTQRSLARYDRLQAPPPVPRLLFCSLLI
ncbi:hypothetical protein LRK24_12965 [Rhodanobacter denitrificans]|uniref:hypothetical protein n=1 Tax=Rhodanobacter denitrificans TaxID=666685 RepID=UPI000260EEFB|nr:hypothetical protein [Rhodanobacter denitrificans]EIM00246.1 hypothetical protein UUC_13510 [Rhodanobacter denitrificans]UJJ52338.1 hypothetical protein LRK52_06520 [Rhodanobacter denitrificans]UJM89346.1 hypothetical protein LRK24_12965 [Rhodanobacter denitrificans]